MAVGVLGDGDAVQGDERRERGRWRGGRRLVRGWRGRRRGGRRRGAEQRVERCVHLGAQSGIGAARGIEEGAARARRHVERALAQFELPVFVKPANLGSSVGIAKAHTREEQAAALADAARYDTKVIVERSIEGQDVECAVLGNRAPVAATPCEIIPSQEFYD